MKKILVLVLGVLVLWVVFNRRRVFVRDPQVVVYRNNVKQTGVQVFINSSFDVLLEKDGEPRILVQEWDKMPGAPTSLYCVRWVVCLTSDDHAPTLPIEWKGTGPYDPQVSMTGHLVTFVDGDGATVRVEM